MVYKQVGCRFKNTKTGKIKDVWLSKRQFESEKIKYLKFESDWVQIPYELDDFGRYE